MQAEAGAGADLGHRIQNPLSGLSDSELMADVEDFANENQLMDILPELRKGALVARDPAGFESLNELSEEEKQALAREVTHKWSHTRTLYFTIITCSIGAAVQGWDQTGSNGANLSFPTQFGIGNGGSKLSCLKSFPSYCASSSNQVSFVEPLQVLPSSW